MFRKIAFFSFIVLSVFGCNNNSENNKKEKYSENLIEYAEGFELYNYDQFQILVIKDVSPESKGIEKFILHKSEFSIPDSLSKYKSVTVPIQNIVVTSTTHIPSLSELKKEETLLGFPGLKYISTESVRSRIEQGLIQELGKNERLDTESVININPDVLVSFAVTESNQTLENLKNAGITVILNGDWNEKNPLGKAEWIKLFGALYNQNDVAKIAFDKVKQEYLKTIEIAKTASKKPNIITGNIYQDIWYLPKGDSWSAQFLKDANTNYYWNNTSGSGSLGLSFEEVFATAQNADYWIGAGMYTSFEEMENANQHYKKFKAFQNKNVYSYLSKKGKTGGAIYYELASNRPDLVLKDIIKITHPTLLPEHELYFFEQLK